MRPHKTFWERRAAFAQRGCKPGAQPLEHQRDNSVTGSFVAKAQPGTEEFAIRVAQPVMNAVDGMPRDYRLAVHDFGYVDVYRAWRRGIPVATIRAKALAAGGRFVLEG
jgi:hypothetical protein